MTVRQLEALIRLPEAVACCHLDNQVQSPFSSKTAANIYNKSGVQ